VSLIYKRVIIYEYAWVINAEIYFLCPADGSLSDTAVNLTPGSLERPRGHRVGSGSQRLMAQNMSGLGKKSSSTSQLSATGMIRAYIGFPLSAKLFYLLFPFELSFKSFFIIYIKMISRTFITMNCVYI